MFYIQKVSYLLYTVKFFIRNKVTYEYLLLYYYRFFIIRDFCVFKAYK